MDIIFYLKLLIILILLYIVYDLTYKEKFANENHEHHNHHEDHKDHEHNDHHKHHEHHAHFPLEQYVGHHRLVNIIAEYNGKEYYLTMESLKNCQNDTGLNNCLFYTPILLEKEEVIKRKDKSKLEISDLSEICNLKRSQDCRKKLTHDGKIKIPKEKLDECNKAYNECAHELHDATEFRIIHYGKSKRSFRDTYKVVGALHEKNGKLIRHALNTPGGISTSQLICFDGNIKNHDITTTFEFVEVPKNSTADPQIYALRFQRHASLSGVLLYNHDNTPKTYDLYVGVCLDNRCNINNKHYLKLCGYENLNDINVLHFKLNLVKK